MGIELSTLALAGTLISGAVSAVGAVGQVQSQNAVAGYQADVARMNAKQAEANARNIELEGTRRTQEEGWRVRGFAGQQRAALAANGLDVGSGSALAVQEGTRKLGMRSVMNVGAAVRKEAYNQRVIGTGFQNEAALYESQSHESAALPVLGSLIDTAASAGSMYQGFKVAGVPTTNIDLIFG